MTSPTPKLRRPRFSLRIRLVLLLSGIICLILAGQTLFWLSSEVTDLDHRIATQGTIHAQGIANACAGLMGGSDPHRFDFVMGRIRRTVDLIELAVVDPSGKVLAHSDATQVGHQRTDRRHGVFGPPRSSPGLVGLFGNALAYQVSAPVLRGSDVLGFIYLEFRSNEIAERAGRLMRSAATMALFWLIVGAAAGTVYVRRITKPLAVLTQAAQSITEGRLDAVPVGPPTSHDEVGTLQASFRHLQAGLRAQRAENAELLDRLQQLNDKLQRRVNEVTAELRQTAAYLESVFRCMEVGLVTVDAHGDIVQANQGADRQLTGLGRPEAGKHVSALIPDGEALGTMVETVVRSGAAATLEVVRSCEVGPWHEGGPVSSAPSGGQRTLGFRMYPLRGPSRTTLGAVILVTDLTEERLVESRLRRHDRLASLGTIAAGLAHELGNYMHGIGGFSSILLKSLPPDSPHREDVQTIHDDNAKAVALLERFLQFARLGQVRYQTEPVGTILREATGIASYRLRKANVQVVDTIEDEGPEARCDARLLTQVFVNLVLNAVDAMEGRAERRLTLSANLSGQDRVVLRVEDTGGGIDPAHVERIFDPFFTTKGATGTGLGLSIAHQIIERHGGTITVQSRRDQGTTFVIELPCSGPLEQDA
jgi:signal transduction histidine kinase